jgi:hypothetical protein
VDGATVNLSDNSGVAIPRLEAQLMLSCTTAALIPERADAIRDLIRRGINWELVTHAAPRQAVMPLVYRALIPAFASSLPSAIRNTMRRYVQGNALRNLHLAAELLRLCRLLTEQGISALALKGPALAASAYGDITLRQFSDLDILVRERDLRTTLEVLQADGFRPFLRLKGSPREIPGGSQLTLVRDRATFAIDLHWRLSPSYFPLTPEGEELWSRATQVNLGAGSVLTLGCEDTLLHLCVHGARHGWQSLSGICDVAAATRRSECDWKALTSRAEARGSLRALLLGCLLAHDLLEADIPATVVKAACHEPSVRRAARVFCRYLHNFSSDSPRLLQRWLIPISMITRPASCLSYLLARAFLPAAADWEFVYLPRPLFPLYYALRPVRLAIQKSPELFRTTRTVS